MQASWAIKTSSSCNKTTNAVGRSLSSLSGCVVRCFTVRSHTSTATAARQHQRLQACKPLWPSEQAAAATNNKRRRQVSVQPFRLRSSLLHCSFAHFYRHGSSPAPALTGMQASLAIRTSTSCSKTTKAYMFARTFLRQQITNQNHVSKFIRQLQSSEPQAATTLRPGPK